MNPDGLLVEGLCVSYRRFGRRLPVLFNVDLAVAPGEALGVVGESGCGKSTLALAIVRFLPSNGGVESGRVWIGGRDVLNLDREELRELRGRRVGMVYQDPGAALNPALRVGEQVAEVFLTHEKCSKSEAMEHAVEMLERVYLPGGVKMLRRYPHQLSGGQQQRVVIAMALAGNPDVLILDEPTTGLDATVEAEVLDLVSELRRQYQTALLFISHNLAVVGQVCERVAVLYAGRVVETGAAFEIFRRPRHPYTHGLLGCVPKVGATKRANRLEAIPGSLPVLGSLVRGCQFSPRCVLAVDACRHEEPELAAVGGTQLSRCLRAAEVPEPDQPLVAIGGSAAPVGLGDSGEASAPLPAGGPLPADESRLLTNAPAVKVEALTKVFPGGVVACDAVSLEIARGETVGLVGESGSGKSTLARCIAGLTVADEGEIRLDGSAVRMRLAKRTEPQRRNVQMVFQNPDTTLNPRHSVSYVLRRAVRKLGGRTDAESLAERTGIGPTQLAVRAGQLSGGQRQRVAIARAFAGSPLLVLCDEPVSSLDVSVQATILNLFADFQRSTNVAYLFVSHDLGVVRYLADRIIVMYRGRVLEEGLASDVFNPPHHPYTEALFSALPVLGDTGSQHRIRLAGEMPAAGDSPEGCCFQSRCPRKLGAICEEEPPPERLFGNGHVVRCHLTGDQLMDVQRQRPKARI